ncbi:Uncharacterized protein FKW44_011001 [Caligus rogercresseyi]|uniref:DUF5641 domain-containing protein n=1 Tax=Caligus rogercresseyi TaxID=217165 RepID=A0A7T8K8J3_CALRO|nr:Uncharacterized protein FKW44_011001 [Caligus rogercresseyi]
MVQRIPPRLQTRGKWRSKTDDVDVNDIVLISEENTSRSEWPLARVVELMKGRDGNIRTLKLRTAKGKILSRPIQRLHLFEKYFC